MDKLRKDLAKAQENASGDKDKKTIEQLQMIVQKYAVEIPLKQGELDNLQRELTKAKARIHELETKLTEVMSKKK